MSVQTCISRRNFVKPHNLKFEENIYIFISSKNKTVTYKNMSQREKIHEHRIIDLTIFIYCIYTDMILRSYVRSERNVATVTMPTRYCYDARPVASRVRKLRLAPDSTIVIR